MIGHVFSLFVELAIPKPPLITQPASVVPSAGSNAFQLTSINVLPMGRRASDPRLFACYVPTSAEVWHSEVALPGCSSLKKVRLCARDLMQQMARARSKILNLSNKRSTYWC